MSSEHNEINGSTPTTSKLNSFLQSIGDVSAASFGDEGERMQALLATQALLARLESPWDTCMRLHMVQPALGAALKIFKDLQLFEKWHASGDGPMTSAEVTAMIDRKCDPALLYRLLRLFAANHLVTEVSIGTFKPTQFGLAITAPVFNGLIYSYHDMIKIIYARMPDFFAENGYKNPKDPKNTTFQYAHGWNGDLWSYYQAHPKEQEEFNVIQQSIAAQQPSWTAFVPPESLLGSDPGKPLLVDVGGSIGHDILKFHEAHPEVASRLYIEDLEPVVEKAVLPQGINKVAYDFFTPQPVKGARAYLMHSILHDWSDEPARKILEMQKSAMTPGYSRLLIHDHVDIEGPANPQATAFDIQMMGLVAGQERSERQWRDLLGSVGLSVVKIWSLPSAAHSVIEVEVPL